MASAEAQTVPCEVIPVIDRDCRGPGWARNQGAGRAQGMFVVFLDADDELSPEFVQQTARAYEPGRYVYTDWVDGSGERSAPDCDPWLRDQTWHPVTTLIPTEIFRASGGFDEHLPGIEDRDFYLKLRSLGYCGKRLGQALFRYHGDGQRSEQFRQHVDHDRILKWVDERYRSKIMACGCNKSPVQQTSGEHQAGDVLAKVLYAPSRQFIQGRFYERPRARGAQMWVAREHVLKRPDLWQIVSDPEGSGPDIDTVLQLANVS